MKKCLQKNNIQDIYDATCILNKKNIDKISNCIMNSENIKFIYPKSYEKVCKNFNSKLRSFKLNISHNLNKFDTIIFLKDNLSNNVYEKEIENYKKNNINLINIFSQENLLNNSNDKLCLYFLDDDFYDKITYIEILFNCIILAITTKIL